MQVELLSFEGCPHVPETEARLSQVLAALAPEATLTRVEVPDAAAAERHHFLGSPSVRIDGRDLEGRDAEPASFACRVYEGGGAPPRWLLEAAVLRALRPIHVLFLCVANSARSQLAEGLARRLAPPGVRVSSAGSVPTRLRPEAAAVLAEVGIDASTQHSKPIEAMSGQGVDLVITLCAEEVCPAWLEPAARVHWGLPDPAAVEAPEARLAAFRATRDELLHRLEHLFADA